MWQRTSSEKNETNLHTPEKRYQYKNIEKKIVADLTDALILHKMKLPNGGKYDLGSLYFDDNWELYESKNKGTHTKGPVDVLGEIEKINIRKVRSNLHNIVLNHPDISKEDKLHYQKAIDNFIRRYFIAPQKEIKDRRLLKETKSDFYLFYTKFSEEKAKERDYSEETALLYKNICFSLANILHEKNPRFINPNWEINESWLKNLGEIFLKTIKHIPNSWSGKSFHKIFHDGDFNFLRKEKGIGMPIIWTLDHYVRVILYLMDPKSFNAYAEWGIDWEKEWAKSKKTFLNLLFASAQLEEEEKQQNFSKKESIHHNFAYDWESIHKKNGINHTREASDRYKTEESKIIKIWSRTPDIKDESWIRSTYYGDLRNKNLIEEHIDTIIHEYLQKQLSKNGVKIKSIRSAKKGDLISDEKEDMILSSLLAILDEFQPEIDNDVNKRFVRKLNKDYLEDIKLLYKKFNGKELSPALQSAYKIADERISRGSNGNYKDFKLIVEYGIDPEEYDKNDEALKLPNKIDKKDEIWLFQEISFYPVSNDLNMGNHHFLDLEKKIFLRIKNMNDNDLGKSISLNKLRYFTEAAIKDISFEIDKYEEKINKWLLPSPVDDAYKYLELDWEKLELTNMIERNMNNSEKFDAIIALVLNYFIKKNKIFYINDEYSQHYWLITPHMLRDNKTFKLKRFTSYQVLKNIALDTKHENDSISFYTEQEESWWYPHFYNVKLWDLWDLLALEKMAKSEANKQESKKKKS